MLPQVLDVWDATRYHYRDVWKQSTDADGHLYADLRFSLPQGLVGTFTVVKNWFDRHGRQFVMDNYAEIALYQNVTDGFTQVLARKFYCNEDASSNESVCTGSDNEVSCSSSTSAAVAPMQYVGGVPSSSHTKPSATSSASATVLVAPMPNVAGGLSSTVARTKTSARVSTSASVVSVCAASAAPRDTPYVYHPQILHSLRNHHIARHPREYEPADRELEYEPVQWVPSSPLGKAHTGNTDSE